MSPLTQARLKPITQRCLSISPWRLDSSITKINQENPINISGLSSKAVTSVAIERDDEPSALRQSDRTQRHQYCSGIFTNLRQRYFSSVHRLQEDYVRSNQDAIAPIAGLQDRQKAQTKTLERSYLESFTCEKETSIKHSLYSKCDPTLTESFSQNLATRGRTKRKSYYDQEDGHKRDRFRANSFLYPLVAFMTLFNASKTTESDHREDELTDEQKMRKMKPIELKIARGVLSMSDQDYGEANELFHDALRMAQEDGDEEREKLILNLLAANFFESGDYKNAEKLFIDLMKRYIADDVSPTAPAILELSLKLASIYSKNPESHDKAMKGYKFVINSLLYNLESVLSNLEELDIHELSDSTRDELALLGWSYDWFAKHLLAVSDYNGAGDMLQRALDISSKVLGPVHDQTLILLNDIGTTLAMNGSPQEGKTFIKKAVEGAIASQSKELASFYVNLGLVNLKLKKFQEAKRYCEYSIELAKKNREHYNSVEVIELSTSCLNEVNRLLDTDD